jgi:hypothetical protein
LVELARYEGLEEAETEIMTPEQSRLGHLVASMINSGSKKPQLWLQVSPNRPNLKVRQTVSVRRQGGQWVAKTHFEIEPEGGSADEVRVTLPANLKGAYEVQPALPVDEMVLADGRRRLTLRYVEPLMDRQAFSLLIPLPSERVTAPDLVLEEAGVRKRFVVLPRKAEGRSLRWDLQKLERVASTPETITYRVAGDPFRAALIPRGTGGGARVHLADVQLAWGADGMVRGVAYFDLESTGRSWAPLVLPESCRLVRAFVDGAPVDPVPAADKDPDRAEHQCRISLGPRQLPHRVTVVFTGQAPPIRRRGSVTFDAPRLGDVPVEKSIWHVACPASYELRSETSALRPLLDVLRADSLTQMVRLAAQSKSDDGDKRVWLAGQKGRYRGLNSTLERYLGVAETAAAGQPVRETRKALQQQWQSLESLCHDYDPEEGDEAAPAEGEPVAGFWRDFLDHRESELHCAVVNGRDSLTLQYRAKAPTWTLRRGMFFVMWLTFFGLVFVGVRRGVVQGVVRRWPQGVVVLVGLVWWLWLTPSVLGLVIVTAGVWLSARSVRTRRRRSDSVLLSAR